jgi:hypothetical protein
VVFEAVQAGHPELAIGGQPCVEICEWLWPDSVQAALGGHLCLDNSGVLEDSQMLGDGGLAESETRDELADRLLTVAEQFEDREAVRVGKDPKCRQLGHRREYARQAIYMSRYITGWRLGAARAVCRDGS